MAGGARAVTFPYDLERLLWLRRAEDELARPPAPTLQIIRPLPATPARIGVLAGSFNPPTRGHEALIAAALRHGITAVLLLLPLRAVDKESVTRAAPADRALLLLEWAAHHGGIGVGLVNRGLYVEQAALLTAQYPSSEIEFLVGHDKIVQIFDPRYYAEREVALQALFSHAAFRVAPRLGQGEEALRALLRQEQNRSFAARVAPLAVAADVAALSSTVVRAAVHDGSPWETLVPAATAHFMRETLPYSPPLRLPDGAMVDAYGLRLALLDAAAAGRLDADADFATLCREARAPTPRGRDLRAWLAHRSPTTP